MDATLQTTFWERIFLLKIFDVRLKYQQKFIPKRPIDKKPAALIQIMAWYRTDDKALFEPLVTLLTSACIWTQ